MTETVGPIVPPRPRMPPICVARLGTLLQRSRCYLEYGSGGSTILAGSLGVPRVISTESDRAWQRSVSEQFNAFSHSELVPLSVDLGPTREWGFPIDHSKGANWPAYATTAWEHVEQSGDVPDLVLIDGRFRSGCLLMSLACATPGTTILFDDYGGRTYKDVVERFIQPSAFHGRMAEFVVPATVNLPSPSFALTLAGCFLDPE